MSQPIYLVVGVPGSGKSWVCEQLKDKFNYLSHDDCAAVGMDYVQAAARAATDGGKPVLIETPFSVSQILKPLQNRFKVTPVFIIETHEVTTKRYEAREGRPIPPGHITRIATYIDRAEELGAYWGTSAEVLAHLQSLVSK